MQIFVSFKITMNEVKTKKVGFRGFFPMCYPFFNP